MDLLRKIAYVIFKKLYFEVNSGGKSIIKVRSRGMFSFIRINAGGDLLIEEGTTIGPFSRIACSKKIRIGNDVSIAQNCYIADYQMDYKFKGKKRQTVKYYSGDCIIKDSAWFGVGSVVISSKIGENSVIGANSTVVNFDVPDNHIFIGDSRLKYSLRKIDYKK